MSIPSDQGIRKVCPRCGRTFLCHAAQIARCDCMKLPLTPATTASIQDRYDDCLCAACLQDLSADTPTAQSDAEPETVSGTTRK
ncbi:cysteine-rich CWC family protein [Thiorhodococcus fuscus]|uniref:Cysteine-rich CWC family protein n=1 Tax=Thiorhodococcus fuscus TaxID=527200 RepID=A0ABW4Y9Y0_9GAMM